MPRHLALVLAALLSACAAASAADEEVDAPASGGGWTAVECEPSGIGGDFVVVGFLEPGEVPPPIVVWTGASGAWRPPESYVITDDGDLLINAQQAGETSCVVHVAG